MAKKSNWSDDYWLLIMQIYLYKPVGVKPLYNRMMVNLGIELHIHPSVLHEKMQQLANLDTPRIERLWNAYSGNPQKLSRAVKLLREMNGFHDAGAFYDGVDVVETFESDFKPIIPSSPISPVMLILVLDLYFRLTPATMVSATPEIQELARMMKITTTDIIEIMDIYQHCDPYLNRRDVIFSEWLIACQKVWSQYSGDPIKLADFAEELKAYFS